MKPAKEPNFVLVSYNSPGNQKKQKKEKSQEPFLLTFKGMLKRGVRDLADYTVSCMPGSDGYTASVSGSPYSYSEEKHKSATFILGTQSFGIGLLLNDIQHSHNKKGFYDNAGHRTVGALTNEEYHYGSEKYEDDGSKKKVIYHLPTIQQFEQEDQKSRESSNEMVQGIDWPKKIKNSYQCLFAVNVSPGFKYKENIEELAKTIKHLPYNEEGNIDFSRLKIAFVGTNASYKNQDNNAEKLNEYLQQWVTKMQVFMRKKYDYIIPDECFVVLNGQDNPLYDYTTNFDVSVDKLLESGNPHVKKDSVISPFSYSEEKHKNAAFILGKEQYDIGLLLNDIQESHNNDTLYDKQHPNDFGEKTGEEYHYGQEKYEENEKGDVKKVIYHLPTVEKLDVFEAVETGESSNHCNQSIDWPKKINNSSRCLFAVNVHPSALTYSYIESLSVVIENLPYNQDGSIDFSKLKIAFVDIKNQYDLIDNNQKEIEKLLKKKISIIQKEIKEKLNYTIPDECFVVLNDEKNPMNPFKTSFDVSVDQLLGSSSIE